MPADSPCLFQLTILYAVPVTRPSQDFVVGTKTSSGGNHETG